MSQRAAEHYTEIADIKRVFKNSHQMYPEFVVSYFGKLNREQSISLLRDMMGRKSVSKWRKNIMKSLDQRSWCKFLNRTMLPRVFTTTSVMS